jgi:predicted amidohydrolase YtcJ
MANAQEIKQMNEAIIKRLAEKGITAEVKFDGTQTKVYPDVDQLRTLLHEKGLPLSVDYLFEVEKRIKEIATKGKWKGLYWNVRVFLVNRFFGRVVTFNHYELKKSYVPVSLTKTKK